MVNYIYEQYWNKRNSILESKDLNSEEKTELLWLLYKDNYNDMDNICNTMTVKCKLKSVNNEIIENKKVSFIRKFIKFIFGV